MNILTGIWSEGRRMKRRERRVFLERLWQALTVTLLYLESFPSPSLSEVISMFKLSPSLNACILSKRKIYPLTYLARDTHNLERNEESVRLPLCDTS